MKNVFQEGFMNLMHFYVSVVTLKFDTLGSLALSFVLQLWKMLSEIIFFLSPDDRSFIKMFVCQTQAPVWRAPSRPSQLSSSAARTAMSEASEVILLPGGYITAQIPLPPSHLTYHLCD